MLPIIISFTKGFVITLVGLLTRDYVRRSIKWRLFGFMTPPVVTCFAVAAAQILFPSGYLILDILTLIGHLLIFMSYDYVVLKWLKEKNKENREQ